MSGLIALSIACTTTTPRVSRLEGRDPAGFVYALPRTVFQVSHKVSMSEFGPSECTPSPEYPKDVYQDHLRRLGIDPKNVMANGKLFNVSEGSLVASSEPDPDHVFVVERVDECLTDESLRLSIGPDGVIQSSDASAANKVGPALIKTIEVLGGLAGGIFGLGAPRAQETGPLTKLEQRCKEKVEAFERLQKDRENLSTSLAPHPKDAYELRTAEFVAAQERIKAEFLGLKKVTMSVIKCNVVPKKNSGNEIRLFTLHRRAGIALDAAGACRVPNVFVAANPPGQDPKSVSVKLVMTPKAQGLQSSLDETSAKEAGLYYRVPGAAYVDVQTEPFDSKTSVTGAMYTVAQFGVVRSYPQLRGPNPRIAAELHPETGAIKSITLESKAHDLAAYIGAVGGAGAAVLEGQKARSEKAEKRAAEEATAAQKKAADESELGRLQQERVVLETMVAIKEARESLAAAAVEP